MDGTIPLYHPLCSPVHAGYGLHGPCQLFGLVQGQTCRPTLTHGLSRSEGQRPGTSLPDAGGCHYMSTKPIVKDTRGIWGLLLCCSGQPLSQAFFLRCCSSSRKRCHCFAVICE